MIWLNKLKLIYYEWLKSEYYHEKYYLHTYKIYTKDKEYIFTSRKTTCSWEEYYGLNIENKSFIDYDNNKIPFHLVQMIELVESKELFTTYFLNPLKYYCESGYKIKTKEDADEFNAPYYDLCEKINKIKGKI